MKLTLAAFTDSRSLQFEVSARLQAPLTVFRARFPEVHVVETEGYVVREGLLAGRTVLAAEILLDGRQRAVPAAACSIDPGRAVEAFLGEIYERIAAATFRPNGTSYRGTARELTATGAAVFDCLSYLGEPLDPSAYPYPPFDEDAPYRWLQAEALETGEPVWVPAALVAPGGDTAPLCELTSIGVAAGRTLEGATEHAVAELHERSVLRRAWLWGEAFPRIGVPDGRDDGSCPDWTVDAGGVWSGGRFCALVLSRHVSRSLCALGSGCSSAPLEALGHAFEEAVQGRLMAWLYRHEEVPGAELLSSLLHQLSYCSATGLEAITGLLEPVPTPMRPAPATGSGIRLTLLEFDDLVVVRALQPGLQPMEARHCAARVLGNPTIRPPRETPHPFG